jgi:hypothetical protein
LVHAIGFARSGREADPSLGIACMASVDASVGGLAHLAEHVDAARAIRLAEPFERGE